MPVRGQCVSRPKGFRLTTSPMPWSTPGWSLHCPRMLAVDSEKSSSLASHSPRALAVTARCVPARTHRPQCGHWHRAPKRRRHGRQHRHRRLACLQARSRAAHGQFQAHGEPQTRLMPQLGTLIDKLRVVPCLSPSNPTPHTCIPGDPAEMPTAQALTDIHIGVVSSRSRGPASRRTHLFESRVRRRRTPESPTLWRRNELSSPVGSKPSHSRPRKLSSRSVR